MDTEVDMVSKNSSGFFFNTNNSFVDKTTSNSDSKTIFQSMHISSFLMKKRYQFTAFNHSIFACS